MVAKKASVTETENISEKLIFSRSFAKMVVVQRLPLLAGRCFFLVINIF